MNPPKILVILGPTAVGKSVYALKLAQKIGAEIISADSMQVYRLMDIGTAKPTAEARKLIPHYLIDIVNPDESFTVVDFLKNSEEAIKKIQAKNKIPIISGGTGFYFKALFEGLKFPAATGRAVRQRVQEEIQKSGLAAIYEKLKTIDPAAAGAIHINDARRIGRALEVFYQTGQPISAQKSKMKLPYEFEITGLALAREKLYQKIEARVDQMLDQGLVGEVKNLLSRGYSAELQSMQALGYKETIDYLNSCYSFEDYVTLLKKKTRNLAKRQLTWFRAFKNVNWINL